MPTSRTDLLSRPPSCSWTPALNPRLTLQVWITYVLMVPGDPSPHEGRESRRAQKGANLWILVGAHGSQFRIRVLCLGRLCESMLISAFWMGLRYFWERDSQVWGSWVHSLLGNLRSSVWRAVSAVHYFTYTYVDRRISALTTYHRHLGSWLKLGSYP